ncbi:Uncharacterised protein [Legionella steigerwaltii]|uniref:Uncharacterized protein n=1 Tax=Legionella steigerwaltii TaxID=460 RepID=A0A378L734_9GAMM|nr:hypothetical protein [Legionella steigerwaltii]KTD75419.1 hypothetical protein Lstg_2446 [Legionella steigerwaltii]STY22623.1 Uncharacterised protein [Legionella steigerwaltii]
MLTDTVLDQAVATLSSYGEKTKVDPDFDKYKRGIKNALIKFIIHCKEKLPPAKQLEYLAKEMEDKPDNMSAKIDEVSDKKRTWSLAFALAALAIERKNDLPKNHPEIVPIDTLLSGLSNGWVTGFKFNPKAVNNVLNGMKDWIQKYDINQGNQTKHEILLTLYAAACAFEAKISSAGLMARPYKSDVLTIKNLIANKFNELKIQLESESRQVLQKLLPKEKVLHQQFKEQLMLLKNQQQELSTSQEKFARIDKLQQVLNKQPSERIDKEKEEKEKMKLFWQEYNTPQKFDQLLADLGVTEQERPGWKEYFNYQHGSYIKQAKAAFWTWSWGPSESWGGIASNTICVEALLDKCKTAKEPLQALHSRFEKQQLIPDGERPSQLIDGIEKEFKKLAELKKIKMDSLKTQLIDVMEHKTKVSLNKINSDIEELKKDMEKQKEIIQSLRKIHEKIEKLKKHVDCADLEKTFGLLADEVANTISYIEEPIPSDYTTAEKITVLDKSIARALDNVQGLQLSLNHMVTTCRKHESSVIQLVTEFVNSKEKTWGHTLLSFFSPSYKKMFDDLKSAIALNKRSPEASFSKLKAVLGLTYETSKKKEIKSQFKALKEHAIEVLNEEIPVYEKSS